MRGRVAFRALAAGVGGLLVGTWLWAEAEEAAATRRALGSEGDETGLDAVIVLGYGNRGRRANAVNRFRVRAALRSFSPSARDHLLVACGGAVAGAVPEAVLLAAEARLRGYRGRIALDRRSTSTRENVIEAIPLIEDADAIRIVSNALHAQKAREVLWELRPDLARRLLPGREHRFGEIPVIKTTAALLGKAALRRMRAG